MIDGRRLRCWLQELCLTVWLVFSAQACVADPSQGEGRELSLLANVISGGLWYDLAAFDALEGDAVDGAKTWLVQSMSLKLVILSSINADISALSSDGAEALCFVGSSDDLVTKISAVLQDESIQRYMARIRPEVDANIRKGQALFGGSGCSTSNPNGQLFVR